MIAVERKLLWWLRSPEDMVKKSCTMLSFNLKPF